MRSIRNINDPANRPEVGTSEAAVSTCVSLIAGMCEQPEAIMEYWLDLYYFVRAAHEREKLGTSPDIIRREDLLPELRKLWMEVLSVPFKPNAEFGIRNAELGKRIATRQEPRSGAVACCTPSAEGVPQPTCGMVRNDTAEEPEGEERREQSPRPAEAEKPKDGRDWHPGNQYGKEAAEFKRKTVERLDKARAAGVTASDIAKVCNGAISRDQIMMIAAREKVPIAVYKVLAAGLDMIAEKKGGTSREHEGTDTGAAGAGPAT